MKVCFEKDICSNLDVSLRKEWLEVNQLGSYACSTIYGLNYRKYHGLFVVPSQSGQHHNLLLSKFEESVFIGSQVYEISANNFTGGIHPDGYKYLQRFCIDPFPTFTYLIDGRRLEKTMFMLHDQNTLIIRYTNKNQGLPLKLILKPILASRDISDLTHESQKINTDSYHDDKVVRIAPKPEVPELSIYYLKGDYIQAPLWYYNYKYTDKLEVENKSAGEKEDLFNTGFFSCELDTYESLELYITVDELSELNYDILCREEKEYRKKYRSRLKSTSIMIKDISKRIESLCLSRGNNSFLQFPDYPYTHLNSRNTILSLFGYTLVEKNTIRIRDTLIYLISKLEKGLLPNHPTKSDDGDPSVDTSLLLIYFMIYFFNATKDVALLENVIYEPAISIIDAITEGTDYNTYRDKDGLIFSGANDISVSSFPSLPDDTDPVRYGKMLELNTLYYSALKSLEFFSRELKKNKLAKKYAEMAALTRKSFLSKFWDESQVQFSDVIRENYRNNAFRINQLFLVALPFSVLDDTLGLNVLKQLEGELLTPFGLRSLSYRDKNYVGKLSRIINSDDPEYYLGCVWPWSIRLYVAAVLKYRGQSKQVVDYLKKVLDNFKHVFYYDSIASLPEIFEGNPPHRRNGGVTSSLTMNEFLLAYYYLRSV